MPSQRGGRILKGLVITVTVVALLVGAGYGWYRYTFPYGYNHCCLKCLGLSLLGYAQAHDGHFPTGGRCPEASLSLLYRDFDMDAHTLCGKTKSAEVAREILERGELLGPDTCDWHYVDGLTLCDDPRIAIVWDKVGLGHDGQRLSGGGHSIWRLGGGEEVILGSEWPQFLEEQERLMAARTEAAKKGQPSLTAKVRLPSGEVVDHYDAPYSLYESYAYASGGGGSHSSSDSKLNSSVLRWRRLSNEGTWTFVLSLNGWKSKPVIVCVSGGKVVPDLVLFEMQPEKTSQPPQSPSAAQSK
jgi:hypothetical protein